jgi:cytochrome c oxidase subunit 2
MTDPQVHPAVESVVERVERKWLSLSIGIIVLLAGMAAFTGIHQATMPQARVETVDPTTLHIRGEFVESNLGSAVEPDGSVTVRAIGQQYSFAPQCMVVPTQTPITFRATSADVVHGLLIEGTNINTMLVPGYISSATAQFDKPGKHLMPCQEFCGVGHEGMWGKIEVVDRNEFLSMASNQQRMSCAKQ